MASKHNTITIDIDVEQIDKIERLFFNLKMDGLKKGLKVTKRGFFAYLLDFGLHNFDQAQFEKGIPKFRKNKV